MTMPSIPGRVPQNPHMLASSQLKLPQTPETIEGLKVENALLMRRNLYLLHADIKLRAALELATGVPWDSENLTDLSGDQLEEVVARNMTHGLQMPIHEAREKIRLHKRLANPSQQEIPEGEAPKENLKPDPLPRKGASVIPTIKGVPTQPRKH